MWCVKDVCDAHRMGCSHRVFLRKADLEGVDPFLGSIGG